VHGGQKAREETKDESHKTNGGGGGGSSSEETKDDHFSAIDARVAGSGDNIPQPMAANEAAFVMRALRAAAAGEADGEEVVTAALRAMDEMHFIARDDKARPLEIFRAVDSDGSGIVDVPEMQAALLAMGLEVEAADPRVSTALLKAADRNHDGHVDYAEFVSMIDR